VALVAACAVEGVVWVAAAVLVVSVVAVLAVPVVLAAAVPGIVTAPIAAKSAVATVAAAAEPTVRRRLSRSPASRLPGVGAEFVLFMNSRLRAAAEVSLRRGWESPVKMRTPGALLRG